MMYRSASAGNGHARQGLRRQRDEITPQPDHPRRDRMAIDELVITPRFSSRR
jgi:hypothetical protein